MDAFHGGNIMKTGEARGIYSSVLKSYNEQKVRGMEKHGMRMKLLHWN